MGSIKNKIGFPFLWFRNSKEVHGPPLPNTLGLPSSSQKEGEAGGSSTKGWRLVEKNQVPLRAKLEQVCAQWSVGTVWIFCRPGGQKSNTDPTEPKSRCYKGWVPFWRVLGTPFPFLSNLLESAHVPLLVAPSSIFRAPSLGQVLHTVVSQVLSFGSPPPLLSVLGITLCSPG